MKLRLSALLAAVGAVVVLVACDDSTAFRAQFAIQEKRLTVYAMNGTPPSLPSALAVRAAAVQRIDPSWTFDVAFDMDEFGFVRVYSVKTVASELSPVNRVGFAIDSVNAFDAITKAPNTGYAYDTTMSLLAGRTLLIDVFEPSCQGQSFLGFNIRAKLIIDSVDAVNRSLTFRLLANSNCGFRSLVEGLPKD
jgi:hypothetical protein